MKTKTQKQEELKRGKELLEKSKFLLFADFTKVAAEDMRRLRRELAAVGGTFLVIKKRLLELMLKGKGMDFEAKKFKTSLGTV
ncbi:MAG: 50S ribosomal protein L10, partial [Patescibacteria group bacterium]